MAQQEPMESSQEQGATSRLPIALGLGALVVILGGVAAYSARGPEAKESDVETTEPIKETAAVVAPTPVTTSTGAAPEQVVAAPAPAPAPAPVPTPTPTPVAVPPVKPAPFLYKVGTYTAQGNYVSPGGLEAVTVTLTVKNDLVTDTSFVGTSEVPRSQRYMDTFASNYKPLVIGKNLADLNLTKVSGSSLTPMGFNDAVNKIKAQAKS